MFYMHNGFTVPFSFFINILLAMAGSLNREVVAFRDAIVTISSGYRNIRIGPRNYHHYSFMIYALYKPCCPYSM